MMAVGRSDCRHVIFVFSSLPPSVPPFYSSFLLVVLSDSSLLSPSPFSIMDILPFSSPPRPFSSVHSVHSPLLPP